ncbi:glucose-6-phosphate dehydrogenase (coenzyme-F420) [Kineococcus sp. R8]|uniref:glucose-6-phosphate dehydrogenase (coenzyme-F420) n=1 Tax=Kineococcus siccus TaxID=2696567 RepID=UPI001412188F|nr:glucose-6-phosphate dehydrogenase (coenzyme-F420) [Kineococcus siccus]NAZ80869.1 glucose-6-phosphate dehydrogenase (coenzyme-F420) [Kineococcus siccus]
MVDTHGQRLKLGYKASAEQFGPGALTDFAVQAEDQGLDSVWISDHFQPWRHEAGHAPSALVWLAHVAARTSRVQFGTSVMTPTLRYNPAVVAQAFATLGVLHPGRPILGVGTGEALNETAVGSIFPETKERFARLREAVKLIRTLWTEDRVEFEGEFYSLHNATVYDKPDVPVPIFVAAGGPGVTKYAGRAGDGYICTSGKGMDLYSQTLLPALEEGLALATREVPAFERTIEIKLSFDEDPDRALENCRFWAPLSLSAEQKHDVHDPVEMARLADQLPIEQVAKRWIVSADPRFVADRVQEYVDAGFTHLVFHGPGHDQSRFLDQFTRDVVPLIRQG